MIAAQAMSTVWHRNQNPVISQPADSLGVRAM